MSSSVFAMQEQGEVPGPLRRPVCRLLQAQMAAVPMRDHDASPHALIHYYRCMSHPGSGL